MKNESEKEKLDSSSFLLAVTIILFFIIYMVDIIMFDGRGFAKVQNFLNLFISNVGLIVVAIGMTIVMITGSIDIPIDSVVATVCMILAWMMERGNIGAFPAVLITLVTGCILGLVQDFLAAYLEIQPSIVTLTGIFFARGIAPIISQKMTSTINKTFAGITTFKIYLPSGGYLDKKGVMIYPYVCSNVITALMVPVIVFVVLKHTKFGRPICAIGEGEQSILLPGLNVRRIRLQVHVLDGFLAGLGGPLFCMNTCSGSVEQVKGFGVDAVASSAIGGTLPIGDVGNVTGSLFGILVRGTIESFVTFQGTLPSWWVRITITALPCLFIVLQNLIASLERENRQ